MARKSTVVPGQTSLLELLAAAPPAGPTLPPTAPEAVPEPSAGVPEPAAGKAGRGRVRLAAPPARGRKAAGSRPGKAGAGAIKATIRAQRP